VIVAPEIDGELRELMASIRLAVFDFDGVFTDNTVYVDQNGTEMVRCWRGDGLGLRKLDRLGVQTVILSTETNPVVSRRARKLGIACVQGLDDKCAELERTARDRTVALSRTCYLGNDINDADCLRAVGLPVVVGDAHGDVLPLARYRTRAPGGRGSVRELCDLLEWARGATTVQR
jgi:3-deoxy-D-manno-octulosonate 8-phosphate phosphatase (KDO 8-P phosphatase)